MVFKGGLKCGGVYLSWMNGSCMERQMLGTIVDVKGKVWDMEIVGSEYVDGSMRARQCLVRTFGCYFIIQEVFEEGISSRHTRSKSDSMFTSGVRTSRDPVLSG